ncbi:MAG: threonine synthase [Halanaerobiales bacterium]|nr:threonine synthase [Halanaerobiales bacterium]
MQNLFYKSTRGKEEKITSSEAIVKGMAVDGGLYVPTTFPVIGKSFDELIKRSYQELSFYIMKKYFSDFDDEELKECINKAYDDKFDSPMIAPLSKKAGVYFLELYHGPTLAFKDMALSILPHLLKTASRKLSLNNEVVILTATSGDTGKAALEGFKDIEGIKIIVFFPQNGVSEIQKRQMITQKGNNTYVIGIEGNFDDAQNGVKEIFADQSFRKKLKENNYIFSSANSINIGRLIPQIVYYFSSYLNLLKNQNIVDGEKINIVVPTGNFGNILAAFYAKKMGLPVNKLISASNENNVLSDFLNTGVYNINRDFKLTSSPSMDILVSSNLERFLHELSHCDEDLIKEMMDSLKNVGRYEITDQMKEGLNDFYGGFSTDKETFQTIREVFDSSSYVMDTHTAVAYSVYRKYKMESGDNTKTVIVSTASPFKFTRSVYGALCGSENQLSDFELIEKLAETGLKIPEAIVDLDKKEIIHREVCQKDEMKSVVEKILSRDGEV